MHNGYYGIVVWQPKKEVNLGTLWRNATAFDASFIGLIGKRFKKESSDTSSAWSNTPVFQYENWDHFLNTRPYSCELVAVDLLDNAEPIETFKHPKRAIYILGGEDRTLPRKIWEKVQHIIKINTKICLNVAQAGGIVAYDRCTKDI